MTVLLEVICTSCSYLCTLDTQRLYFVLQSNLSIPDTGTQQNCPYYRGVLISEVNLYCSGTTVSCLYYRGCPYIRVSTIAGLTVHLLQQVWFTQLIKLKGDSIIHETSRLHSDILVLCNCCAATWKPSPSLEQELVRIMSDSSWIHVRTKFSIHDFMHVDSVPQAV